MFTFTIIALVIIIIIKFLMYSSKPENQIEASDVRKKFKPFIETIMNSYMKSNIMCSVSDIDDDKIFYTLYFTNDSFRIEITYNIFSLKLNKYYNYKVSEMDGQRQIKEAKDILNNFHHLKLQFEKDNEITIIQEIMNKHIYN